MSNELDLGLNPFCFDQEIKIKTKKKNLTVFKGAELVEKDSSNNQNDTYFSNIVQTKEVDKEEFIKLYTSQVKAYFDLTKTAYKVFFIFLCFYQDSIGKDYVYLSCKKAMNLSLKIDHFELSESIFYRGIRELVDKKIIAKTNEKNWYFTNPAIVFNGDRARFINEIVKKKEVLKEQSDMISTSHTATEPDTILNNENEDKLNRIDSKKISSINNIEDVDRLLNILNKKKEQIKKENSHNEIKPLEFNDSPELLFPEIDMIEGTINKI